MCFVFDLNWAYSQLDFTSWNLWWRLIDYLMKIAFDLCITSLCEMCECAEVYKHIWYCNGCYCAINNRALDCRTVKVEGPIRANVVERVSLQVCLESEFVIACMLWLGINACYRDWLIHVKGCILMIEKHAFYYVEFWMSLKAIMTLII